MAIWFWPVGSQYVVIPPSFSCTTATLATERTICADPLLEKIDADFTAYYWDNLSAAKLFQATVIESELKKSEADFITARNRCGRSRWCIERQYLYQDIRISDLSGEPHRTTVPLRIYLNHYLGAYFKSWLRALLQQISGSLLSIEHLHWVSSPLANYDLTISRPDTQTGVLEAAFVP
jgi:hypothetical protein